MRYTFKAFFQDPDEADLAYGRLRERGLVEDIQIQSRSTGKRQQRTLDLYGQASATTAAAALSSSMLVPFGLGYGKRRLFLFCAARRYLCPCGYSRGLAGRRTGAERHSIRPLPRTAFGWPP